MRRFAFLVALMCGILLLSPATSNAQISVSTDSLRADSLRADSLRKVDSLSGRTQSAGFERAARRAHNQLLPLPAVGIDNLLPNLLRWTYTRDSIDWAPGHTVADMLMRIPGVMVLPGGTFGRPEVISYQGRGAGSVSYTFDGVPFQPIGDDSVAVDPSLFSLVLLERIEVEGGAGLLHVDLITRRHNLELPRTRIGVAAGDQSIGRYSGAFERRYPSGLGLTLAAESFNIGSPQGTGGTGSTAISNGMAQVSYYPSSRYGAQVQYLLQAPDRGALVASGDTLSPALKGTRGDLQLRGFWRRRSDEMGLRVDAFASRTSWSGDSIEQTIGHIGAVAAYRQPAFSSQLSLWHHTEWTPVDVDARAGWTPSARLTGAIEIVAQTHSHDRSTAFTTGSIGVGLPFGITATGLIRNGHRVQSPALETDVEQRFTDMQLTGSYQRARYGIEAGYARNDGWQPVGFRQFAHFPLLAPLPTTQWATLHGRVTANSWLTFETFYSHPLLQVLPGGSPPHHAVTTATIRSRFQHNFPSGIFDMKLQGVMESWSPGIAGLTPEGVPVAMPGKTFFRATFQLQIGPFIAYYDRVNLRGRASGYLPGYTFPALSSTFGVRWAFLE